MSDFCVRLLGSDADLREIGQISRLCANFLKVGEEYASTPSKWVYLYRDNPERSSFSSILVHTKINEILGHFGLFPLPLRVGNLVLKGAAVSNAVVAPEARSEKISFNGIPTFPILSLIDQCCSAALGKGIDAIIAFSSIPSMMWRVAGFETREIECGETIHLPFRNMIAFYAGNFYENRWPSNWRAWGYGVILSVFLKLGKIIRGPTFRSSDGLKYVVEEVEIFDAAFDSFTDEFVEENRELLTYDRSARYFNWRFASPKYRKFLILFENKIVGSCVLLASINEKKSQPSVLHDFILLQAHIRGVAGILKSLQERTRGGFIFTHYLSSDFSKKIMLEAVRSGYVRVPGIGTLIKTWRKNKTHSVPIEIHYRLRDDFKSKDQIESLLGGQFHFNPLFFVPCPYGSENR